jgi:XTP/dITP diphosphohydrolase
MADNDRLVIASNNANKIREIKAILHRIFKEIVSMGEAGLAIEVEETGDTFKENAVLKATAVANAAKCWALADDSGLCVDALGGAPGIYSSRWSGKGDEQNNEKLLEEMKNKTIRSARYMCVVALAHPGGFAITAEGICEGSIGFRRKGRGGFGYDPLFVLPERRCTMAELFDGEKNAISHRGNALRALLAKIGENGLE